MATPNIVPRADSEGGIGTTSKYWASAYIDAVYVGAGKVGRDADNALSFATDDLIKFRVQGATRTQLSPTFFKPQTNDQISLGVAGTAFSDLFLASGAVINFDNGNVTLTHGSGAITSSGHVVIADSKRLKFGSGHDLEIYHDTSNSYITQQGTGNLYISNSTDDSDIIFETDNGSGGTTQYFRIDGGAKQTRISEQFNFLDSVKATFGTSGDLAISHNGTNSSIVNLTGHLYIQNAADDSDIVFQSDDGSGEIVEYFRVDGGTEQIEIGKNMRFADNVIAKFGTGGDLQIKHNATASSIENYVGDLTILNTSQDNDIVFKGDDGQANTAVATYFYLDGSSASHDGSATTALYTNWPDKSRISVGTGHDLRIYHDGTQSLIDNMTGDLYIRNFADDGDIIFQSDDGSGGATAYLTLDGGQTRIEFAKPTQHADNAIANFGSSSDMQIYHNGTDSYILNGTGDLKIINNTDDGDIIFSCDDGSGGTTEYLKFDGGAAITLVSREMRFGDSVALKLGAGPDFEMSHDGSNTIFSNGTGNLKFKNNTDDGDIIFESDDGSGGTAVYIRIDGSSAASGDLRYVNFPDNVAISLGDGNDLRIYHYNGEEWFDNSTGDWNFRQIGAGDMIFQNLSDDKDIVFQSDDGSGGVTTYFQLDGSLTSTKFSQNAFFVDDKKMMFGNSLDLQIYHDGTDSKIINSTGDLYINQTTDDKDIIFMSDDGSGGITTYLTIDGSATNTLASQNIKVIDDKAVLFGTGGDAFFKHTGSQFSFFNDTGPVIFYQRVDDGYMAFQGDDGSGGLTEYFRVDGQAEIVKFSKDSRHNDSVKANFGTGNDLQIYHTGTGSVIQNAVGNLTIQEDQNDGDIIFRSDDGSGGTTPYLTLDGGDVSTIVNTIKVLMPNLPTSDPSVAGQLWNDSGTLKISAG